MNQLAVSGDDCFVRLLREQKNMSQRTLVKQMGIPRANLQRLERMTGDRLSFRDLELVSRGLGYKLEELIGRLNVAGRKDALIRSGVRNPSFLVQPMESVKFGSFLKQPDACFIGSLKIGPQKMMAKEKAPRGHLVFYFVFEGTLVLSLFDKEHVFKTGECFSMADSPAYELYNPHQLQEITLLCVVTPSFIRTEAK